MKRFILAVLFFFTLISLRAEIKVLDLVCEYKIDPIGIDVAKPRLSWKMQSEASNVKQLAYEVRTAASLEHLTKSKKLIWSTGKVISDQSFGVVYEGPRLRSKQRVYWQVRIWDSSQNTSAWSEPGFWEMGILEPDLWTATMITMKGEEKSDTSLPSQYYRTEFKANKQVESARVYITSLGLYQLFINGVKVGDDLFTPGYTSYNKRLQYQTYDVTDMIEKENAIGAMVGDGWYRGYLGWNGQRSYYGDQLGVLIQLEINYSNGAREVISTDKTWRSTYGAVLESDIYNGEKYDSRLEMSGWTHPNFDQDLWKNVEDLEFAKDILVAPEGPPVRAIEEITPQKIIVTPMGEQVFDLGQNMVGWVRLKVKGNKGDRVTMQFAEALDKEGNFYTKNLRAAEATDVYILNGEGEEVFEPHFTFHGFRYVKLDGFPGEPTLGAITGVVIHSDMKPTGTFSCSDPLINQLQSNIQWSQRDNFLDIPTDCPQRDERVGWTGDAQVFSMTAAFNFDVAAFYTKWLKDLAADQLPNGMVPHVIPDMLSGKGGATAWGDAAVIIPWTVYQAYGDKRILENQYASMKGWVEFMREKAGDDYLWNNANDWHWGDWLAFHSDKPDYAGSTTEKDLIATAYFQYSTSILSKTAEILGHQTESITYRQLADQIKQAFIHEYTTASGRLVSHTQTAYALALSFDLLPEKMIDKASSYFAQEVEKFGHLTTGFVGTPLLCTTLSEIGRDDLAFMLLNRKAYPSWLYPVTQGATTIWERWDTQKPDGTIIEGMNSFNHYAYGAIGEWLYNHVAGIQIDPQHPGYKHIILSPHPGGGLQWVKAEFLSIYGLIKSSWAIQDNEFVYEVVIPANSTATILLPTATLNQVNINDHLLSANDAIDAQQLGNTVRVNLGSGSYSFKYPLMEHIK